MAHNTVQAALNELIERQIVYEITGRQKGRSYACGPVLTAVFGSMNSQRMPSTSEAIPARGEQEDS
jgi:hypothetical protein